MLIFKRACFLYMSLYNMMKFTWLGKTDNVFDAVYYLDLFGKALLDHMKNAQSLSNQ